MGRHAEGWKLRQRAPGYAHQVRFTHNGIEYIRSTGTSDREAAAREAARIYADIVRRSPVRRNVGARGQTLEELVAAWLVDRTATNPESSSTYDVYAAHFLDHFSAVDHLTPGGAAEYMRARLRVVQAGTVRKELSALRSFLAWCVEFGVLEDAPAVPSVPTKTLGTRFEKRRRVKAIELSPREVAAFLSALPEWSTSKKVAPFPIRARFVVGYETSLRPSTLDRLSAPDHYQRGQDYLDIPPTLDKNRWDRSLPLSRRAQKELDRVCPESGLIFGAHDYREHVKAAALEALDPKRAAVFIGAHLRSARLTHWGEDPKASLLGIQFMAGHKQTNTTARYMRPSLRAAEALIKKR